MINTIKERGEITLDYKRYREKFVESFSLIFAAKSMCDVSRFAKGETRLLANLHCNGGKMQAKKLASMAGITTARVTAILNVEEEKGYIRREAIAGDRRKVNVILTEAGEIEFQKRHREIERRLTEYFDFLGEADTENLLRIMDRTKEFFEGKRKEEEEK